MAFDILTPADDDTLHWRQPSALKWRWVLAAGDREFGELTGEGLFAPKVEAATATGRWRYHSGGSFWKPSILVHADETPVASFEIVNIWKMTQGNLLAPDQRVIGTWTMTKFMAGEVEWTDPEGARLIRYRRGTDEGGVASWFRAQCRVDFTPAGFAHPDRDLMLCLGWYFTCVASNGMA